MASSSDSDETPAPSAPDGRAADKLVISSIMTHAKLLDMIKERNPIIARRDRPKGR
jgi:hypothetical protein